MTGPQILIAYASSTDWFTSNALHSGDVIQSFESGKQIERKKIREGSGSTEGNAHSQMYTTLFE